MTRRPKMLISCCSFALAVLLAVAVTQGAEDEADLFQRTLESDSDLTDGRYRDLKYSDGWHYEMEIGATEEVGLPVVYAWTPELAFEPTTLRPGKPVVLSDRDALPLLVVANGKDREGLALAGSPAGPWRFVASMGTGGDVQLTWYGGENLNTPAAVWSEPYHGTWPTGWMHLDQCLAEGDWFAELKKYLGSITPDGGMPLALQAMIQADWRRQDAVDGSAERFSAAGREQLERARRLLADLQSARGPEFLTEELQQLAHLVPRFVQRNQIQVTPPGGTYGACGSRLMKLLADGHEDVQLSAEQIRRLAAWIDLNAIFYGVYDAEGQVRQLAGQRVAMPDVQ